MPTPLITVKNLSKTFPRTEGRRRVEVFHAINLQVHQGEFLVLLGPSGCGKSTLLRIMAGLEHASGGEVTYASEAARTNISFVFQNFGILPWLTVSENVELGLIGRGVPRAHRLKEVHAVLEQLGLMSFKDHHPFELSGGMKQRVGLARAFVTQPGIIFLDEPFSELDFFTAASLRNVLLDLWKERGTTVVMVSHYVEEAVSLADRIVIFSNRPSSVRAIVHDGLPRPRELRDPKFFAMEDEVLGHFEVRQ